MAERIENRSREARCPKRSRLRLMIGGILAGVTLAAGTGCSTLNGLHKAIDHSDCIDDFLVSHRNRAWAARAWHREKVHHGRRHHIADFRQGFLDAYAAVAEGGDGCTPPIAPRDYWGWRYQSAEGQEKVGAWFAGYPMGAAAAETDGLGNWSQIRTNFPAPVEMPPYQGDGTLPAPGELPTPGEPVPIVPVGSEFAPTAADAAGARAPNMLDWSAVEAAARTKASATTR